MKKKEASSQAAWALITEGVTDARLCTHRIQHQIARATKLVEKSEHKEHLYQVAGDIIVSLPERIQALEIALDRTALALSYMGKDFLEARLPLSDKQLVEDAITPAFGEGGKMRQSIERVAKSFQERQGKLLGKEESSEVLDRRFDGKSVREHIQEFVKETIRSGQGVFYLVEKGVKEVNRMYVKTGETVDPNQLRRAVQEVIEKDWGRDKMSPLLARALSDGEFLL